MSETRWWKFASHASCHHGWESVAVLVSAWPATTHALALVWAGPSIHRHWRVAFSVTRPARSTTSTCRADAWVSHWIHGVQWGAVIVASAATIMAVGLLALHFESSKLRSLRVIHLGGTAHWWWAVGSWELVSKHTLLAKVFVVVRAIHVRIFSDTLFARLPAHKRAAHSAGHDTGCNNENCSRKHDPAAPFHMWHEKKNVNQEGQKSDEQGWYGKNEKSQEEARRVSRRMEMRSHGQREADQNEQRCNWVHYQDRRQTGPSGRGQREVISIITREEAICGIPDLRALASIAIAPAKDAEVIALITAQWDLLDDGC
jgi:hypothetical protein